MTVGGSVRASSWPRRHAAAITELPSSYCARQSNEFRIDLHTSYQFCSSRELGVVVMLTINERVWSRKIKKFSRSTYVWIACLRNEDGGGGS